MAGALDSLASASGASAVSGKAARLTGVDFDKNAVNALPEEEVAADEPETAEAPEAEAKESKAPAKA